MDDETISGDFDQVVALTLDDDVCTRCSSIPWANATKHFITVLRLFSPICRICRLLYRYMPSCQDSVSTSMALFSMPIPDAIRERLDEHKFQLRTFRVEVKVCHDKRFPGNRRRDNFTILVSDLTHEQAEMALQLLSISPVMSLSKIGDNIRDCVANHGHNCALKEDRTPLHLRVIDCNTRTVVDAPADCNFVALSYVWGRGCAVQESDIMKDIPLTVEHSIYVTVKLGFKYLWVDRYCINQQDQRHKDDQISQMTIIYSTAQLTIVAAAGGDPTHGLPGIALHPRPGVFANHEKLNQLCLSALKDEVYMPESSIDIIAKSVWASRAWTYQEAMFSRRRLIFTKDQAIFSCNKNTYLELGEYLSNDGHLRELVPWFNLVEGSSDLEMKPIRKIMEQYCKRTLSYESDALRAISGTLNRLLKDRYFHLWGVPGRILKSICTDREEHQQTRQQTSSKEASRTFDDLDCSLRLDWHGEPEGRRRLGFPSWSPLGWSSGPISWKDGLAYIGRISFDTSLGQKEISEFIQYARTDHTKIPQQLNLSLKTTIVEVCEYGDIALSLDNRFQVITSMNWDGFVAAEGTFLKAAVISEDSEHVYLLLLEATGDNIYERRGCCFLETLTLTNVGYGGPISGLKIWYDDSEDKRSSHKRNYRRTWTFVSKLEDLDTADQERLRTSFGDLKTYEWWKDIFTQERIILG